MSDSSILFQIAQLAQYATDEVLGQGTYKRGNRFDPSKGETYAGDSGGVNMAYIKVKLKMEDVVVLTEDHGGYKVGRCLACHASGWLDGLGYPRRAKKVPVAHLHHKKGCPMNKLLNNNGGLEV